MHDDLERGNCFNFSEPVTRSSDETSYCPLVSVIIPMYNAAQFIPQTMESLLRQTMKNFEVIIIDDCSSDNSIQVVEKSAPPLLDAGIKIHILELAENIGTPGTVRNFGIDFAHGKYVTFLDADDLLMPKALEELSFFAEKFQADVVHTDTFFFLFENNPKADAEYSQIKTLTELLVPENLTVCQRQKLPLICAPTFETQDISQRIRNWINRGYNWESVTMFCRRDFLSANKISFPKMLNNEDMLFSFFILCRAEKFLRVPNITYIYRQRKDSVSHKKFSKLDAHFHKWLRVLNSGINEYDKFMTSTKFFIDHPDYYSAVLDFYLNTILVMFGVLYEQYHPSLFNELIKKEFHPDDAALTAHIFNVFNIQRLQIERLQAELEKFHKH